MQHCRESHLPETVHGRCILAEAPAQPAQTARDMVGGPPYIPFNAFKKCRPIRSPEVQSTLLEPSSVRALSTSSGVPAWTCRASSWVTVSVRNPSIMHLLIAHGGFRGRLVQEGFYSKSIVRASCSARGAVYWYHRPDPAGWHRYLLQDAFSTNEPLRLYMIAVSAWQPPSQEV
jgi:hypothetical protein